MTATLDYPAACRLFQVIKDEPRCTDHTCPDCHQTEDKPMTTPQTAYKIAKYTIIGWAIFVVVFLAAAMVFGPELS